MWKIIVFSDFSDLPSVLGNTMIIALKVTLNLNSKFQI